MKKPADAVAANAGFFEVHQEVTSMQSSDKAYPDSFPIANGDPAGSIPHLLQLLDRPIAFHRCFVTLTGSVTAALMLSQAVYWQKRTTNPDGWWYKSHEEWTEETGLKRRELEAARIKLRALEVLEEKRTGSPAKLWYRIDLNALEHALHGTAQKVTVAEILTADRRNLVQISKAGLMRARRAGITKPHSRWPSTSTPCRNPTTPRTAPADTSSRPAPCGATSVSSAERPANRSP